MFSQDRIASLQGVYLISTDNVFFKNRIPCYKFGTLSSPQRQEVSPSTKFHLRRFDDEQRAPRCYFSILFTAIFLQRWVSFQSNRGGSFVRKSALSLRTAGFDESSFPGQTNRNSNYLFHRLCIFGYRTNIDTMNTVYVVEQFSNFDDTILNPWYSLYIISSMTRIFHLLNLASASIGRFRRSVHVCRSLYRAGNNCK